MKKIICITHLRRNYVLSHIGMTLFWRRISPPLQHSVGLQLFRYRINKEEYITMQCIKFRIRSYDNLKLLTVHYASILDTGSIGIIQTASTLYTDAVFLVVFAIRTTWFAIMKRIRKVDRALLRWFSYFINSTLTIIFMFL